MSRLIPLGLAASAALLATLAPTPSARDHRIGPSAGHPGPPPIESWQDEDAEQRNKQQRKTFFKQMHRAAPGVDTDAIERANGLAQIARRNRIATAPPSADTPTWIERGSANQAGRIHVARFHGDTLYAGSDRGGIWRASRDAEGWTPIGDNLYGGAHSMQVLTGDDGEDIVIAGTRAGLLHRTEDDGETWVEPAGIGSPTNIRRLLMKSDGSQTLFMVACGWYSCDLLRSEDLGASFETLLEFGDFEGDVWLPRDGGTEVWITQPDGLHRSEDDGESWELVGAFSASDSAELAASEAGGPRFYVVADDARLLRSDDAGQTWTQTASIEDYWGVLGASQLDPDLVAWGGVQVHRGTDGGYAFTVVNDWWEYYGDPENLLHADIWSLDTVIEDDGTETWTIGTDGGLYRSTDGLRTVQNLSMEGLRVSQYYDTLTSSRDPEHIAAGAQDQGYQVTATMSQDGDTYDFEQILSGDYGHLTSGDGTHDIVFSVYPGMMLIQIGETSPQLAYADFPTGDAYVPWMPPVVADPDDPEAVFFAAAHLYRYARESSWTWTPSRYSDQDFATSRNEYMSALAFSPLDSARAYAATSEGRVWISDDHGLSWTQSDDEGPDENWYYGQAIVASSRKLDRVYLGGSGYSGPAVYRSEDGGQTFEAWDEGLPDTLVYCLAEAPDGRMFAGTETSAWSRAPADEAWQDITGDVSPVTTYWSCEVVPDADLVRFGTYGRGIWDYELPPFEPGEDTATPGDDTGAPADDTGRQLDDQPPDDDDGEDVSACGCSSGGAVGGIWLTLLALAATARRRD